MSDPARSRLLDRHTLEPLLGALRHPSAQVRSAALRVLVRLPLAGDVWSEIGAHIRNVLSAPPSSGATETAEAGQGEERREAIAAAAYVPLWPTRRLLREIAATGPEAEQAWAAHALARSADPAAAPRLAADLSAPEVHTRAAAAEALCWIDPSAVRDILEERLHDADDPELRFWLALALVKTGSPAPLQQLLQAPEVAAGSLPLLWGDPHVLERRLAPVGPLPDAATRWLRGFAGSEGVPDRIRHLARTLAGTGEPPGEATLPQAASWPTIRQEAEHLTATFGRTILGPSEIPWNLPELPEAPAWDTATALVLCLVGLLPHIPDRSPMALTLAGNAIAGFAGMLGEHFVPDVPHLFEGYATIGQENYGLRLQVAWMASRGGLDRLVRDLAYPLRSSAADRCRLGCHLVEDAALYVGQSYPPLFGGGAGPADVAPPSTEAFLPDEVLEAPGEPVPQPGKEIPAAASPTALGQPRSAPWGLRDLLGGLLRGRRGRSPSAPPAAGTPSRPPERSGAEPDPVLLGVSAPRAARPGGSFTARFAAYIQAVETEVAQQLEDLGRGRAQTHLGVETCRWRVGTPVTVRLSGEHFTATPPEASFAWNGRKDIKGFIVTVAADAPEGACPLCFEALIGGIRVAFIPIDVEISASPRAAGSATKTVRPAHTAFASYASQDRARVMDKVSAVCAYDRGLDVFTDCLDLKPGEEWKPRLTQEIAQRELFLLFWSVHAMKSPWVDWEWHRAVGARGASAIQPMPLDSPDVAPPPEELKHLHFGDRYLTVRAASVRPPAGGSNDT